MHESLLCSKNGAAYRKSERRGVQLREICHRLAFPPKFLFEPGP